MIIISIVVVIIITRHAEFAFVAFEVLICKFPPQQLRAPPHSVPPLPISSLLVSPRSTPPSSAPPRPASPRTTVASPPPLHTQYIDTTAKKII
ncbi:hypothetical protein E2C01_074671 [Portunus trituberculatus]|uniref:Uncharacterized protein n=1 Tax=Portunus trituberculatus TaxID=210409 RepID=A0A5B7IHU4_PORTR|nr:hypothetical protein [Portunus trituberculatus]